MRRCDFCGRPRPQHFSTRGWGVWWCSFCDHDFHKVITGSLDELHRSLKALVSKAYLNGFTNGQARMAQAQKEGAVDVRPIDWDIRGVE